MARQHSVASFDCFARLRCRGGVLVLVLLLAIGAVVLGAGSLLFGAGRSFDDVERFHRARGITTGWAREGVVRPVIGAQKQADNSSEPSESARASADA